jgi:WD40 repeat protein
MEHSKRELGSSNGWYVLIHLLCQGHKNNVNWILTTDQYLFSASQDSTAKQWDKISGQLIKTFTTSANEMTYVAISEDLQYLFTASQKGIIKWRISDGSTVQTFNGLLLKHSLR